MYVRVCECLCVCARVCECVCEDDQESVRVQARSQQRKHSVSKKQSILGIMLEEGINHGPRVFSIETLGYLFLLIFFLGLFLDRLSVMAKNTSAEMLSGQKNPEHFSGNRHLKLRTLPD